jgi:hypothetical protein
MRVLITLIMLKRARAEGGTAQQGSLCSACGLVFAPFMVPYFIRGGLPTGRNIVLTTAT